jgi:hypothetical protein
MNSKRFPIDVVLTMAVGMGFREGGMPQKEMYALASHICRKPVSGNELYWEQPRCAGVILAQYPEITSIDRNALEDLPDILAELARMNAIYGDTMLVRAEG